MVLQFGGFAFLHGIILLDDIESVDGTMLTKYYEVLMQWMKDNAESDEIAYNLIITERAMMIVPRKQDAFCGEIDDDEEDLQANDLADPETLDDDEQAEANVKANADAIAEDLLDQNDDE